MMKIIRILIIIIISMKKIFLMNKMKMLTKIIINSNNKYKNKYKKEG